MDGFASMTFFFELELTVKELPKPLHFQDMILDQGSIGSSLGPALQKPHNVSLHIRMSTATHNRQTPIGLD